MTPLEERRRELGWPIRILAERSGVSPMTISRLERLEQRPSLEIARALSKATGWSLSKLFPVEVEVPV